MSDCYIPSCVSISKPTTMKMVAKPERDQYYV